MMAKQFRPMLAEDGVLGEITYPKIATPKLNGVRALCKDGVLLARSLKPIPNAYTRSLFSREDYEGFDGELIVGDFSDERVYTRTTSGIMTEAGEPDVRWYLFDMWDRANGYKDRATELKERVEWLDDSKVTYVGHKLVRSDDEMLVYYHECINIGYEGLVLRHPDGPYKLGRSTQKEGWFLRYCPWQRSEAEILSIEEKLTNTNAKVKNELGLSKRSHHKAGKIGAGVAGSMQVRDIKTGVEFGLAIGSDEDSIWYWQNKDKAVGLIVKYKSRPTVKVAPRFPQLEGLRDPRDMSDG